MLVFPLFRSLYCSIFCLAFKYAPRGAIVQSMKLTVGENLGARGFALPTILLVATVMLSILMAAIGATAASRVALDSQYYNQLAQQAAESGVNRANECLKGSGYAPQWSTQVSGKDLRPDTDCTGTSIFGSAYVVGAVSGTKIRTSYSVDAPSGSGIGSALKVTGTTQLMRTSMPGNVWRTYTQVTYLQIETQQAIGCPDGFVSVPGSTTYSTSDFCLAKYEAKNVAGKAVSQAAGTPYVNISQTDAAKAASLACDGCHLVTEAEWLTAAQNVIQVASNWSGGAVGSGFIYSGHNDSNPGDVIAGTTNDADGYFGTGNTAPGNQRRTLTLSNGEIIWDLSGNAAEWTAGTSTTGQPGMSGYAMRDWSTIGGTGSLSPSPFPSTALAAAGSWTAASNGIGRAHTNLNETASRGFIRGGNWNDNANAGIFALGLDNAPGNVRSYIGFRIAR